MGLNIYLQLHCTVTHYTNLLVEVVVHRQTEWIIQYHTKIFTNLYIALQTKSTWVCQLNYANHLSHVDGMASHW